MAKEKVTAIVFFSNRKQTAKYRNVTNIQDLFKHCKKYGTVSYANTYKQDKSFKERVYPQ